ncbi:MAG TPA: alanine--tRNA ligase [Candidatus Nanoarchaeia archaeon]|nr:alanine--tRNA ligase [Candidatus Nanoarchaeia archaeon]
MNAREIKSKYLKFFETKGHKIIPSASLAPENDPTVLFTTAGMHPLVPFLMGEPHPLGKRLANVQKCIRTQDIDEVGDETHTTFFEMLGNWSLGDYFKKEAISWSFEFLTSKQWLGLPLDRLAVTCFEGDNDAPKDEEAAGIWASLGVSKDRIAFLPKKNNWWGPAGETGPCGPDTEMFYWKPNNKPAPKVFDPDDNNWVEIWNDVFMQYNKEKDGTYAEMSKQNVDTGMGVERVAMALQGFEDVYKTELFKPIMDKVISISGKHPTEHTMRSFRVITDHMRAATFILGDEREITPSNNDQGYILRRYIRRAIRHGIELGINREFCSEIAQLIIDMYKDSYPLLEKKKGRIIAELQKEEEKFRQTVEKGIREFQKIAAQLDQEGKNTVPGKVAFLLFQSFGFPIEMVLEMAHESDLVVDTTEYKQEYEKHQELSRIGAEKKFKGGLSDHGVQTTRLHTATHLLNEALRKIVDANITQKGSNITSERLRFDFNFDRKLTEDEIKRVEEEVNRLIKKSLNVSRKEVSPEEAKTEGAQAEFGARYPAKVSVYTVEDSTDAKGWYSKEICMGPHVLNTSELGSFKIIKEESSAAGIRRIKAIVE